MTLEEMKALVQHVRQSFRFAQLVWLALTALALLANNKKHHKPVPAVNAGEGDI
jgi:hypothetical protein